MRHIPEAHCTTPWYDDPRTERDELLWPEQFPKEVVDNYEFELGPFSFAGQFMQQPVPRGGGIFKNEWFEAWPPLDEMGEPPIGAIVNGRIIYPALEYVVAWLDTAHTIKEENDFCAMLTFGVFRAEGKGRIERQADGQYIRVADDQGYPKVLLLNAWLKRLTIHGPPEELPTGVDLKTWNSPQYLLERQKNWGLVEWVHHTAKRYKVDHLGIETQAVGHQLEQELHRLHSDATWSVELVPARGDKVARAYAVQGIVSSRQVYLPTFPDGTYPSWVDPCLDQILMFPKGRHDDATDAFCAGLKHLRDIGIFERRGEYEIAEEQSRIWIPGQQRLELPYDL
jgi:predicted phage terminase large subunit-like protein